MGLAVVEVLDRGGKTQSYKYVTLLALMDVLVAATADGTVPTTLDARRIGERVVEIYWRQTRPLGDQLLRHSSQNGALLDRIAAFQQDHNQKWYADMATSTGALDGDAARQWRQLKADAISRVCRDPLPRLQVIGGDSDPFLYRVWEPGQTGWAGVTGTARQQLHLDADAAVALLDTHLLLRPLIERALLSFVLHRSPQTPKEGTVERILFGVDRRALSRLTQPLKALNGNACFYCQAKGGHFQVDHFLPWSYTRDDGIHNLVPAHAQCNASKSNRLAAVEHLNRWGGWLDHRADDLHELATNKRWPRDRPHTVGMARSLYLTPAAEDTPTWVAPLQFSPLVTAAARSVLDDITM